MVYKKVPFHKLNGLEWTPHDLQAKFANSYVIAEFDDKKGSSAKTPTLVYIYEVSGDMVGIKLPSKQTVVVPYSSFHVIDDRPAPCISNWTMSHGRPNHVSAVMMMYNPERQWRRGFGNNNTFLFWSSSPEPCKPTPQLVWDFRIAELVANPVHSGLANLDQALSSLRENKSHTGLALDNRYWLVKSKDGTVKLFRRRAYVGSFLGSKFFYNEAAKILEEELREIPYFERNRA